MNKKITRICYSVIIEIEYTYRMHDFRVASNTASDEKINVSVSVKAILPPRALRFTVLSSITVNSFY